MAQIEAHAMRVRRQWCVLYMLLLLLLLLQQLRRSGAALRGLTEVLIARLQLRVGHAVAWATFDFLSGIVIIIYVSFAICVC